MLRALVLLLVAANLAFFAWSRGWLAPMLMPPMSSEREPERLGQQLRPESVRLLDEPAAQAARRSGNGVRGAEAVGAPLPATPGSGASAASAAR